jgi:thiol:disulfide interchange protein/DsbC/DsbD-like thiol-disulfide interchange protein
MKLRHLCLLSAALFSLVAPDLRAQVQASLVAADTSLHAGRPITVALRLVHEPQWHTYWLNPGTGTPTSLTWHLPAGWTASEIQWPAPEVLKDATGTVVGSGYEGDLLLPITLTPPADLGRDASLTLKASAEWLMCRDVCKPGNAEVSLTLPISSDTPSPDPQWGGKIRSVLASLPRPHANWLVRASRDGKAITLTVTPTQARPATPGGFSPSALHFFCDNDLVAYDQPQKVKSDRAGGFVLSLPITTDATADPTKLAGVLTSAYGWIPDGTLPGLRIDTAIVPGEAAPAGAAGSAAAASPGAAPAAGGSLAATLLLALAGGVILNLMPCVFPVIGIKILGFVNQAGNDRRKVVEHGLAFSAGVLLSFWALAAVLAVLRAGGSQLGWGFQLQSAAFVFGLAAVMLVFALNMSGVFEFGLGATSIGSSLQSKSGLTGSFLTGMLATVVATPCSAPFLAPALGAALALSTTESFLIFTAIAVGLSAPYLLLSAFPAAVKILPRPGAWMVTFRQLLAFPLYGTVGYLIWVMAGQVSESDLLMVFIGLVLVAMGAWSYGCWQAAGAKPGLSRFGLWIGVALLAVGAWTGWPRPPAPMDITWDKWSPEAVAQLRADHRIVYVDFTARWCATCQANKKLVFHSGEVLRSFRDKHVATLRADWTNKDPQITAELAKYHRSAVPFNLVWYPDQADPLILPSLLTPGIVLSAVNK